MRGLWAPVALVPLVALGRGGGWRARGHFALAFALALAPMAARNLAATGEPWPALAMAGPDLYQGNNEQANGAAWRAPFVTTDPLVQLKDYRAEATRRAGQPLSTIGTSLFWAKEAGRFALHQPLAEAKLLGRKLLMLVNGYEVPQTHSLYCTRELFLRTLSFAQADFGFVFPLALPGLFLWWRRKRARAVLVAAGAYAALLVLTVVTSTLRLALLPPLWLAAGLTVEQLVETARRAGRGERAPALKAFGALALPVLLGVGLVQWPLEGLSFTDAALAECARASGVALDNQGRSEEAILLLERARALDPGNPDLLNDLGVACFNARHWNETRDAFEAVLALRPDYANAHINLGLLDFRQQRYAEAAAHLAVARAQRVQSMRTVLFERQALTQLGRGAEADAALDDFLTHIPPDPARLTAMLPAMFQELSDDDCPGATRVGQEAVARGLVLPRRMLEVYAAHCRPPEPAPPP